MGEKSTNYTTQGLTDLGKGLDVGTAFIYASEKIGDEVVFRIERDAFFNISYNDSAKAMFTKQNVKYVQRGDQLYIIGNDALRFAEMFGLSTRRPLERGVISPQEKDALPLIKLMIENAIGAPRSAGETIYYSIPAQPIDTEFDILYHQYILNDFLTNLGYSPKPINEGLAITLSELAEENFTGLALSFGGGLVNVCLANLSLPIFTFSVARGGDWIDKQVAQVINQPLSQVTSWKESFLDLEKKGDLSRMEQALSIYYDILLDYILGHLKTALEKAQIHLGEPQTIVISGGTAKPTGFLRKFQATLQKFPLPFELKEVRLASQLLHSVAKGTLIAAIAEETKKSERN